MKRRNNKIQKVFCLILAAVCFPVFDICAQGDTAIEASDAAPTVIEAGVGTAEFSEISEVEEVVEVTDETGAGSGLRESDDAASYEFFLQQSLATPSDYPVGEQYVITIPSDVIIKGPAEEPEIMYLSLEKNGPVSLTVIAAARNGYDGAYHLTYGDIDSIPYEICVKAEPQTAAAFPVLQITEEDTYQSIAVPISFRLLPSADPRYAGTYHDLLTFTMETDGET